MMRAMIGWLMVLSLIAVQLGMTCWTTRKIAGKLDRIGADMDEALERFNLR